MSDVCEGLELLHVWAGVSGRLVVSGQYFRGGEREGGGRCRHAQWAGQIGAGQTTLDHTGLQVTTGDTLDYIIIYHLFSTPFQSSLETQLLSPKGRNQRSVPAGEFPCLTWSNWRTISLLHRGEIPRLVKNWIDNQTFSLSDQITARHWSCGPAAPWSLTDSLSLQSNFTLTKLNRFRLKSRESRVGVVILQSLVVLPSDNTTIISTKDLFPCQPSEVAWPADLLTGTKRDYHYLHVLLHWSWTLLDTELWLRTTGEPGQGQDTMCVVYSRRLINKPACLAWRMDGMMNESVSV